MILLEINFSLSVCIFALCFYSTFEPFDVPIHVSTLMEDSLVVNRVYKYCVVTFTGCETWVDLVVLNGRY